MNTMAAIVRPSILDNLRYALETTLKIVRRAVDEIAGAKLIVRTYAGGAGGHALRRMTDRVKQALDAQVVLSPGKQGIWPGPG